MDSATIAAVLFWILLNISISSQHYCDVTQTNAGGWMNCYGVKYKELETELDNHVAFTTLTIEFGTIPVLPFRFTWKNQQYLHVLEIRYSGVQAVQDGAWNQFSVIDRIDLSHNDIRKINRTCFAGMHQLKKLFLNDNAIREIEEDAFDPLSGLQELDLSNNSIARLDVGLPASLKTLSLSNNPLKDVTDDVFRNANGLDDLEMNGINLNAVPDLLKMLPKNLASLSIRSTNVSHINATTFNNCELLRRLDISCNSLEQIEEGSFSGLPNLAVIFASKNHLETIPQALRTLKSLLYLDLSDNRISMFDDDLLASFSQLTNLHISNNPLVYNGSGPIRKMNALKYLHLEGTGLDNDSAFLELFQENMLELYLSHNNITTITSIMFVYTFSLKSLDLSYNLISEIEQGAFAITRRLKVLLLRGNRLTAISPRIFGQTTSMECLDLSDNNVKEIPVGIFDRLQNLTSLNLSHNHIIGFIDGDLLAKTPRLTRLYLQGNKITSIPSRLFLNTALLEHLDLSHNQLEDIPIGCFDKLTKLIFLNLSFNRLKTLDEYSLYALKNLQQLYLHHNHLKTISGLESLGNINDVTLENNDWRCDSLLRAIKILNARYVSLHHVVVGNLTDHLKGIPCSRDSEDATTADGALAEDDGGFDYGLLSVILLALILVVVCCMFIVKIYKNVSKNRKVARLDTYRSSRRSNDYNDVKVEDESNTCTTAIDEKNSLYNCYEVVE